MSVKLCPVNWNDVANMEKWLIVQQSKGYTFQNSRFGVVSFAKTEPQEVQYKLKPFIKTRHIGVPSDSNRTTTGWQYVGEMRGLITSYRVYRNTEELRTSCPDSVIQERIEKKVWFFRRIGYAVVCLLLLWLLNVAAVFLTTPLNEFASWRDLLSCMYRVEHTSETPLFLWIMRKQWFVVLAIATLLLLTFAHYMASVCYSFGAKCHLGLHRFWRVVLLVIVCFTVILLFAFPSDVETLNCTPDYVEPLCSALEIQQQNLCFVDKGSSPNVKNYRMTACAYTASPSVWLFEFEFWTRRQMECTLAHYLEEIDMKDVVTVDINGKVWTVAKALLWTGQREGYVAYNESGKGLQFIHYIGEKPMKDFVSSLQVLH